MSYERKSYPVFPTLRVQRYKFLYFFHTDIQILINSQTTIRSCFVSLTLTFSTTILQTTVYWEMKPLSCYFTYIRLIHCCIPPSVDLHRAVIASMTTIRSGICPLTKLLKTWWFPCCYKAQLQASCWFINYHGSEIDSTLPATMSSEWFLYRTASISYRHKYTVYLSRMYFTGWINQDYTTKDITIGLKNHKIGVLHTTRDKT